MTEEETQEKREAHIRNRASRRQNWLTCKWTISKTGNPYMISQGKNIGVYTDPEGHWHWRVDGWHDKQVFETKDAAKLALFDHLFPPDL